jgi:nucleotide-binding universal stress UspA family protein
MLTMKKILVPVDFSETGQAAERAAERLARALGAELVLLHVVDQTPLMMMDGAGVGYVPTDDTLGKLEEAAKQRLEQSVRHASDASIVARARIEHGNPHQEIVRTANEEAADLIVLGTHGRRGFQRFLLGSVAERVVRSASMPVLTVRADDPTSPK